jgi:hypothetical protein
VESDTWILFEELQDQRGLVSGEIGEDDMDLAIGRAQGDDLLQKADEVPTGVACSGLCVNAPVAVSSAAYRERVPCR